MPHRVQFILRALLRAAAAATLAVAFAAAQAGPIGYSVRSDSDRHLYRIDLATGVATDVGATGVSKIEGLAIDSNGELYGVNPSTAQLVKCSAATGACTVVGALAGLPQSQTNAGLAFAASGALYLAMNAAIYRVDPVSGGIAPLGATGPALSGLAGVAPSAACASGLYGMGGNGDRGKFYCINVANGSATLLGTLSLAPLDVGLDGDPVTGVVWGISNDSPGQVFAVEPATLVVRQINPITVDGKAVGGFESLAVARTGSTARNDPVAAAAEPPAAIPALQPAALAALMVGMLALAGATLRRSPLASRRK